jgi:hypothetical protein
MQVLLGTDPAPAQNPYTALSKIQIKIYERQDGAFSSIKKLWSLVHWETNGNSDCISTL